MPMIDVGDCQIHVQIEGPESAPVLMLSSSLALDMTMWEPQVADFAKHYRLIRYDRRGHGKSGVPQPPYSMERMGRDVLAVLDKLGIARVHWCGLSMGGMVGQWLGANAPERFERIVLCNTHSYYADKTPWNDRMAAAREKGMAALAPLFMERWFTKEFRESQPQVIERIKATFAATPVEGFIGCCAAAREMDHRAFLGRIKAPTLIIAGRHDLATPVEANEHIRAAIPGARMTVLEASHISNIGQPQAFTQAVLEFLAGR